jgi:hypothetical protein
MKTIVVIGVLAFVPLCTRAQGAKPCEDLKTEIAAKLDAKGVKSYTLDIVAKDKDADGKVVGTCEAGSKKIVYTKSSDAPPAKALEASKP